MNTINKLKSSSDLSVSIFALTFGFIRDSFKGVSLTLASLSLMAFCVLSCASSDVIDADLQSILLDLDNESHLGVHDRGRLSGLKVMESSNESQLFNVPQLSGTLVSYGEFDLTETPRVKKFLKLYTGSHRRDVEYPFKRRAEYLPTIEAVLNYYNLPLELINLALVESKFDTTATSPRGAKGIWQLMKPTAEELGLKCRHWNDERKDVLRSSIAAARYLIELRDRFDDWLLVIAAYNAGPGRVEAAQRRSGASKDFFTLAKKGLLPKETVNHVSKFIALTIITRQPGNYGFELASSKMIGDQPL